MTAATVAAVETAAATPEESSELVATFSAAMTVAGWETIIAARVGCGLSIGVELEVAIGVAIGVAVGAAVEVSFGAIVGTAPGTVTNIRAAGAETSPSAEVTDATPSSPIA